MTPAARKLAGCALALAATALPAAPALAEDFYGITPDDRLVRFDALDTALEAPVALGGLAADEHVAAVDVRPATGGLYGIALKGATVRLVRIDQATGALTQVGTSVNTLSPPQGVGMDIDPQDDAAVVMTTSDVGLRFDLATGAVTFLTSPSPDSPAFAGMAYTPDTGGIVLAASVDTVANRLVLGNGSGPWVEFPSPLGFDVGATTSLDFDASGGLWMYASQPGSSLYRINTVSGAAWQASPVASLRAFAVRLSGGTAFAAPAFGVAEGDGTVAVTIERASPADGGARVAWSTVDGTAVAGADYTASSGEVTFARGQTRATVTVPVLADAAAEGVERFGLRLTAVDGVPAGPDAAVVVADDDRPAPGGGPGGGGTGADTAAPVLLALPVARRPARALRLPFATSEAGTATVTLRLARKVAKRLGLRRLLARSTFPAAAGANTATLAIAPRAVRRIQRRKAVARATVTVTDAAGNAATQAVKVTLAR